MSSVPAFLKKQFCIIVFLLLGCIVNAQTQPRRAQGPSVLADTNDVTNADYLAGLQKVYEALNKVPVVTGSFERIPDLEKELSDNDSAISLLKQRLSFNTRTFNLQNLHMFRALLNELSENEQDYRQTIATYDTALISIKKELLHLRKDSLIRKVFRTPALRDSFALQVNDIRTKWKIADSLLTGNTTSINNLKSKIAANGLAIQELLYQTAAQLKAVGPRAFQKDRSYIWQRSPVNAAKKRFARRAQLLSNEKQIANYYFKYTRSDRLSLVLISLAFFLWVAFSYRGLIRTHKLAALNELELRLLSARPWWLSLIFLFTLIPAFELEAPALYIELMQVLLALALSRFFYKKIPKDGYKYWLLFVALFLTVPLLRIIFTTFSVERWFILLVNIGALALGVLVLKKYQSFYKSFRLCYSATLLFVTLNLLALFANILGRSTLTQLFYTTAFYALLYAVGLTVTIQSLREAFLVHIKNCRAQKGYTDHFEWKPVATDITKVLSLVAVILWLLLLAVNLDLFDSLTTSMGAFLSKPRKLGGFSITFGGIFLCIGIIWLANFLQKYIAYFFGETGEDAIEHVNAQHSRLLITRLVLLVTGFSLPLPPPASLLIRSPLLLAPLVWV